MKRIMVCFDGSEMAEDAVNYAAARAEGSRGEVLVVTDDMAERETVLSLGGMAASCLNFIATVENALAELADDIKNHNRQERHGFQKRSPS